MDKYIKELYDSKIATLLGKIACLHIYIGIIISYCLGNMIGFWQHSVAAVIVTTVIFFVCVLLPHTVEADQCEREEVVIEMLNPNTKSETKDYRSKTLSFTAILRHPQMRKQFVVFALLVFFQQFSGIAATIVYNQIIFINSGTSNATLYSVIYSLVYLISNIFALFFLVDFNKKSRILISAIAVSISIAFKIAILYFDVNKKYWSYASIIAMIFYVCFFTIGVGTVPIAFALEVFPKQASEIICQFNLMYSSALGLIVTKIFQVLFDRYFLYIPFCMFLCSSIFTVIFVIYFLPFKFRKIEVR